MYASAEQLSREQIATMEIGHTEISLWLARTMSIAFLAAILAVPVAQEFAQTTMECQNLADKTWPRCATIFTTLPEVAQTFDRHGGNLWERTLAANGQLLKNIDLYEATLKEDSLLVQRLVGPTQHALSKWAGLGNEKVALGRDGWLFYTPGIDYVTSPGFLDPLRLAKRRQTAKPYAEPLQPDPRLAIIEFARQLQRRGIALIIVPAPGKPMVHPEQFSPRYSGNENVLHNESFNRFKHEIECRGVFVVDPAPLLRDRKLSTGDAQFLKTDTHWTPRAAEAVATRLRDFIEGRSLLPSREPRGQQARMRSIHNLGDIAVMLRLPGDQTLFPAETVEIREITDRDGAPWLPDPSADVLLLGDSFTNIYSQPAMGWGSAAGLAEQISFVTQRPVDRISQNDSGAFATRQALAQELARGHDRLAGKRLVIWEFAIRELATGDWKSIPLPDDYVASVPPAPQQPAQPYRRMAALPQGAALIVRAKVAAAAVVPQPGSVPYRDAVTFLHLSDVRAHDDNLLAEQIVVYVLGMRDNHLTGAARYKPGDTVSLRLIPWDKVRASYETLARIELDDPDFTLIDLPLFWGEENR